MNKKIYALAALAAFALPAFSRPASPELMSHTNPDGTVVEYYLNGDEHFNYLTDASRTMLLERDGKNIMPLVRDGRKMMLTDANLEQLKKERANMSLDLTSASAGKVSRMAALDASGRTTYPTLGEVRACVILLEYPDVPFSVNNPKEQFNRLCNEKGYSDYNSKGSAKDYFEACSGGKFSPTFDVYGPVKLQHEAKWYVGADDPSLYGYLHNARFGCAIQEALTALDPEVDFSVYDYDQDGFIDNIFFFYSGHGQADTNDPYTVWPHQSSYFNYTADYGSSLDLPRLTVDGVQMNTYACSCELNGSKSIPDEKKPWVDGIGAFCHEYSHVLGLPDLYDTKAKTGEIPTKTPGYFTIMDKGSYSDLSTRPPLYSAYEKWVCKWIELDEMTEPGATYTLYPQTSEDANAYRIRIKRQASRYESDYYILEARIKEGWDLQLPDEGMIIWRINFDKTKWTANQVNVNYKPLVEIMGRGNGSNQSAWPGMDENVINYITPSTGQFYCERTGKAVDIVLSNIAYDNPDKPKSVSFEYNKYPEHNDVVALHSDPLSDQENRTFTLEWDADPDATGYRLTVKRKPATSSYEQVVDGLDDTPVGNVTSYIVRNITAGQWNQTFRAWVRVDKGIPSSKVSNVVTFVPSDLQESGVEGIDAEHLMIFGGKGEIIAPEGARAFNLSGMETGLQNLAPGVYIVVTPKATAKVVVR